MCSFADVITNERTGGSLPQQRKKQSFLHGALILSAAAILTKIIGALFFKIPLQKINDTAYGYFEAVFNIYIPIYIVSTAGFPIAVSRMVSQSIALDGIGIYGYPPCCNKVF